MFRNNFKKLFILIIILFFVFNFKQYVFAVNGFYNRLPADSQNVTMNDWNYFDEDFLLRDGTNNMDADLNLSNHLINNLTTGSGILDDLATVQFVDSQISAIQGGDTYINWGRDDCSGSDEILYSGYGFNVAIGNISGGNNPVCIDDNLEISENFSGTYRDALRPLLTDNHADLPPGIPDRLNVKCAVCYRRGSTCFLYAGSDNCSSFGFNKVYSGFFMSETSNINRNSLQRLCLNENFDLSSEYSESSTGAKLYSSRIQENFGNTAYPDCESGGQCNFVKCAVCCN